MTNSGKIKTAKPILQFIPQMLLTLLLAGGLIQLTFWTGMTLYRHVETSQAAALEQQKISELKAEIAVLEERAKQAREDKTYLERLARKQGFVMRGETVIVPAKR